MKKYLLLFSVLFGIYSCQPETTLLFEESSSERMSVTLETYRELLTAQTNGWLVEYYPESQQSYGGFNLYFKFLPDGVIVKSEVSQNEATSSYTFGSDMGPTLNFDTYNEIFHYFSDPALSVGGGAGFGYEGDYEFIIMSGTAEEFILRGKKTKNTIRMTPCADWESFRQGIIEMNNIVRKSPKLSISVKGQELEVNSSPGKFIIYPEEEGALPVSAPYIVTLEGLKFYEPVIISGITMQYFKYNVQTDLLESVDSDASISFVFPPINEVFVAYSNVEWSFKTEDIGPGLLTAWNNMKVSVTTIGEELAYAWIGPANNGSFSFTFGSYDGSAVYIGSFYYNLSIVEGTEDQIVLQMIGNADNNGLWYYNNLPAFRTFPTSLGGTYTIVTDDPAAPTEFTFTNNLYPTRWFKLTRGRVTFP